MAQPRSAKPQPKPRTIFSQPDRLGGGGAADSAANRPSSGDERHSADPVESNSGRKPTLTSSAVQTSAEHRVPAPVTMVADGDRRGSADNGSTVPAQIQQILKADQDNRPRFRLEELVPPVLRTPSSTSHLNINEPRLTIHLQNADSEKLFQQIICSHPIWYLQGRSRPQVSQLLDSMEPGNFVVRSSTVSDAMALSVKVAQSEVRHYLVEKYRSGVRVEKSKRVFRSLPELIQHYCQNEDEIPVRLLLPAAVRKCPDLMGLQSLARLGADFWRSCMASYRPTRPPSVYAGQNADKVSLHSLQMSHSMCGSPRGFGRECQEFGGSPQTTRRSTLRLGTSAVQDCVPDQSLVKLGKNRIQMGTACPGNGQLRKSHSAFGGMSLAEPSSPQTRRLRPDSKLSRPTKFIRQIFGSSNHMDKDPSQSDYFVPPPKGQVSSSQSEASLWSSSDWTPNLEQCRPGAAVPKLEAATGAKAPKRGLATRLLSFRSAHNQTGVIPKRTKDDMCETMPSDEVRTRRMQFSRGNTDLSAKRLGQLVPDRPLVVSRPRGPPLVPPHRGLNDNAMQMCIEELRKKRQPSDSLSSGSSRTRSDLAGYVELVLITKLHSRPPDKQPVVSTTTGAAAELVPHSPNFECSSETEERGLITPVVRRKGPRQWVRVPPLQEQGPGSRPLHPDRQRASPDACSPKKPVQRSQSAQLARRCTEDSASQTPPSFVHRLQPSTARHWSALNEELKSKQNIAKVKPQPAKRTPRPKVMEGDLSKEQSDYAHLNDLDRADEDDTVSVAGTVFNEPWDSNVWENLFDIVHFYDEKPDKDRVKAVYMECCANNTIVEEDNQSCSAISIDSTSSKLSMPPQTTHSNSDVEVQQVPLSVEDGAEVTELLSDDQFEQLSLSSSPLKYSLSVAENKNWREVSKRIPSEPGTFDSRRGKSTSLLNVADNGRFMSPYLDTRSIKQHRAQTPGMFSNPHLLDPDELSLAMPSLLPALSPCRLKGASRVPDPGYRIQRYVEQLATDSRTTFGATLQQFIECTIDAGESDPHVVIRNVRQFLNGIKNYLVKNGEAELLSVIEEESSKLKPNEFLNIDAILEAVLHKILLVPVKPHLYHLMCRENIRNGSFETLTANLSKVRTMRPEQLGFPREIVVPDSKKMEQVRMYLRKMQNHYSPLKKLENLLKALDVVVRPRDTIGKLAQSKKMPSADELIRWLVFLLARTSTVSCEVEAWYMWELLPQQLLTTGDAAYYLSTLLSAVHVLKNLDSIHRLKFMSNEPNFSTPQSSLRSCIEEASDAYIRVAVPDEQKGSIDYHTFPAVSQVNVGRLCRVIAHQLAITNPEDYGLCVLYDGYETLLHANEVPDAIRAQLNETGKPHLFAYKRHDAKIAWPASAVQLTSQCARSPGLSSHSRLV